MPKAPRHLIFVRHGESEHHVRGLTGGWTDTPLTETGRGQVARTASVLAGRGFGNVALYCSDLKRAAESAEIIGDSLSVTPVALRELREIGNGDAVGLTLEEARKIQSPEPQGADPDWRPWNNAETWREMTRRTETAFDHFSNEADTLIVVGHGNSGQALVSTWLGLPVEGKFAYSFETASISEFMINQWGEKEIVSLNLVPWLMVEKA